MAVPFNPLDVFATYTYHFELHAADSWDKLKDLSSKDENKSTDRFTPNGTLLINTRKDAHQHIDDVRYSALSEATSTTNLLVPIGHLSMTVQEPGGFSFIEKLNRLRHDFKVTSVASDGLVFLLKIFFVGRMPDNKVETLTAKLIPMKLLPEMTATFNELGGVYSMNFISDATLGATDDPRSGAPMNFSFTKRNVAFDAHTVEQALKLLEDKLNKGYSDIYAKEGISTVGKKIRYKVTHDPEIKGRVDGLGKDSLDPSEPRRFISNPTTQVSQFITQILQACVPLQEKIGASKSGLQKEFNPGIFIPVIQPRVYYKDDEIEVNYHIAVNRGGVQKAYVFEYYFADAGKNVDVISFDVKFVAVGAWLPTRIDSSADKAVNQSSTVQTQATKAFEQNVCTVDTTRFTQFVETQRSSPNTKPNDPLYQPVATENDRSGYNSTSFKQTPAIRMAVDSIKDFMSAIATQQVFEIRGHLDLLDASAYYPDGSYIGGLYGGQNIWIKVNIYMPDDRDPTGKRQFFYTNYYKLLTVENIFSGGKFTQNLKVTMVPEIENK